MMEAVVVPAAQNVCTEQEFNEYMENEGTRMIWSVIHRYGKGVEQSDAFQELSIALWRALGSYSPDRGAKKLTYVYQTVYNQMKMMLREQGAAKRAFEKQAKSAEEQYNLRGRDENMEDRILEDMVLRSRSNALHWAIRNGGLTEDEQKTVYMLLQDMLQREIGEKLGCSQGHVSAMRKSALGKNQKGSSGCSVGWRGHLGPGIHVIARKRGGAKALPLFIFLRIDLLEIA